MMFKDTAFLVFPVIIYNIYNFFYISSRAIETSRTFGVYDWMLKNPIRWT